MDSKSDWHYGKKTKTLLFKRKKNKGSINALNGLKKSIDTDNVGDTVDTDNVDDTVDTVPSPSNILYPKEDEAEAVILEISTSDNLNDTQNDEYLLSGRRIVDIAYFFKSIRRKHKGFECSFSENMTLVNEKRNGFSSNFVFKCLICGVFENIYSEDPDRKDVDINMAITSAVINTGQGYSQLDEFTAVLDMPCYANSSYQKYHEKLYSNLFDASVDETRLAGIEEAKLAIQNGEVDNQGRALVTVVADGALSKRSYKTNYNASSGVASIIGYRMKKCLFMSVRNKYCVTCERASNTKQIVREHKCYKNWTSTSTSTESDIIVEGFKES
ncbi:hypothetical protein QTP88_028546 [Uroleucon formosanum]